MLEIILLKCPNFLTMGTLYILLYWCQFLKDIISPMKGGYLCLAEDGFLCQSHSSQSEHN